MFLYNSVAAHSKAACDGSNPIQTLTISLKLLKDHPKLFFLNFVILNICRSVNFHTYKI